MFVLCHSFSFPACSVFKELESVLKIILDMTIWHPMRRLNKTSRNFRGRWQVELLQQGRLRSAMLSEGKHSTIQGFHLGENWLFCYALNPAHLCCQYTVLTPRWHRRRGMPEWVQSHPHCWGKTATMTSPSTSTITTTLKQFPLPLAFLGNLDHCLLIYEHIMANRYDLSPYIGSHFI